MRTTEASQISSCVSVGRDRTGADSPGLSLSRAFHANLGEHRVKRRLIIVLAIVVIGLGLVGYYLYGGSTVPNGQPPLVRLTDSNFSSLKDSFNSSANSVRVIVMLSPT